MTCPTPCVLTTGELALLLGLARRSVVNLCNRGRLKSHPFPGRNQDRRIDLGEALDFAYREDQPTACLEAYAERHGVLTRRCPSLLIVSPTLDCVVPVLERLFAATLTSSCFDAGLLLAQHSYRGVLWDSALGRDHVVRALDRLRDLDRGTYAGVLAGEDDADHDAWHQAGADRVWQKPCHWQRLGKQLWQDLVTPGQRPPVPSVQRLALAA